MKVQGKWHDFTMWHCDLTPPHFCSEITFPEKQGQHPCEIHQNFGNVSLIKILKRKCKK